MGCQTFKTQILNRLNLTVPQIKRFHLLKSWYSGDIGRTFNVYVFFLAYPFISIGNSLSFYIFLGLLLLVNRRGEVAILRFRQPKAWLFLLFGLIAAVSTLLSPFNQTISAQLSSSKIILQLAYWIFLAMFIQTHASKINLYSMGKYLTIGSWLLAAQYFFFNSIKHLPLIVSSNRNSMVLTFLALLPFHALYIQKRFGTKIVWPYLLFVIVVMFASQGRAGAVLVILQSFLIASLWLHKRFIFLAKFFFWGTLLLFSILYSSDNRLALGASLSTVSPRMAEFVEGVGQGGDLAKDESWLTRRLMIEKGKEINEAYPWFGIGLFNFSLYEAQIPLLWSKEYLPLQDEKDAEVHFNRTSSHNSYLQIWTETGYVGLSCFLLLLFFPLAHFVKKLLFGTLGLEDLPLISLFTICLHFYVISAITSALSWFVIGFAYASYGKKLKI